MPRRSRIMLLVAGGLASAFVVAGGYVWGAREEDGFDRRDEIARRGAAVMPFDLERTTHVFTKRSDGGIQLVVADDSDDSEQIALARQHLRDEAEKFRRGQLDDPARIHGTEMPGLAELEAGARRIEIDYEDVPAGGRISYKTDEPMLVAALHDWYDAQVSDHGTHAAAGTS
ncbi:MAG: hypothetical protein MSC30_10505 [Gaiellaceae bacterium MAG52_C11]|nr:hypothetical protein [Candidatus Gaiellasilicea maunaloa]